MSLNTPTKAICTVRLFGWLIAGLSFAVILGWLASQVSSVWSPMFIFPLLVGGLLGALLVVLMRICQVHAAVVVYPIAILAVALVVVSQHWLAYQEAVQAVNEDIQLLRKAAAMHPEEFQGKIPTPPKNLVAYMKDEASRARKVPTWFGEMTLQGTKAWAFWSVDALLVLLPVLFLVRQGRARKWCSTCRSWYRVTRKGRIGLTDAETLMDLLDKGERKSSSPDDTQAQKNAAQRFATFVISDCEGHCGEAELAVLIPATSVFKIYTLDREQRRTVETFLDGDRA